MAHMPASQPAPATGSGPAAADVAELDRALARISYLLTRARRNDLITSASGVPLDRAAVVVLLELADAGAMRPGELAARLEVEAPHITRQVQRLARAGYAERAPDPDDRRAQLIRLTPSGRAAARRIRDTGRKSMAAALAHWPPGELHQLTTLFHRLVDDFLAYATEYERGQPR
jgi:DNA-binding MarR family transcriptional regulator